MTDRRRARHDNRLQRASAHQDADGELLQADRDGGWTEADVAQATRLRRSCPELLEGVVHGPVVAHRTPQDVRQSLLRKVARGIAHGVATAVPAARHDPVLSQNGTSQAAKLTEAILLLGGRIDRGSQDSIMRQQLSNKSR